MPDNKLDDIVMDHVIELLEKKNFKKKLIKKLNENIDVPLFNEKVEKKILDKFYELLLEGIKELDL
tara:strand:+ start:7535 stop:7732 length:198 start_codon:yes stop_codon:yes gene_type:complete